MYFIGSNGEQYRGTIKHHCHFNPEEDCNILQKALKVLDETAIIECLSRRTNTQRLELRQTYKVLFGKNLLDELKSKLSGDFKKAVTESLFEPDYYDAYSLYESMKGLGTRENVLTEILTSRSNEKIKNIKILYREPAYVLDFNADLEGDIVKETSGFYQRILVSCLQANKPELSYEQMDDLRKHGPSAIINIDQAKAEAEKLYNGSEKIFGTDEDIFIKVFCRRNKYQLRAIFEEFEKIAGKSILHSIDCEMFGNLKSALKAIAYQAFNEPLYFARVLYKSMKGLGTNDTTLIRVILSRSEIDLRDIKREFEKEYGKTLESFVKSDTSGSYRIYLLRFIEGN